LKNTNKIWVYEKERLLYTVSDEEKIRIWKLPDYWGLDNAYK